MRDWWLNLSVRNKLQLPIQLLLFLVTLLAQRMALDAFENQVLAGAQKQAETVADGVLNGLNMLMINGIISEPERRQLYITKMGNTEKVTELHVYRSPAVANQFGPGERWEHPHDEVDQAVLASGQRQALHAEQDGKPVLRMAVPFVASDNFRGTNCLMCHIVPAGTVAGGASVSIDLSEEYDLMSTVNYWLWGLQILIQIVLYFLIGALISRVTRPIEQSAAVADRIAAGELNSKISFEGRDEITRQLQAMQVMQDSLTEVVNEIKHLVEAAAVRGDFSVKMKVEGRSGYVRDLADLLNRLSSVTETGLADMARVAVALADGNLAPRIERDYPGVFGRARDGVNQIAESLTAVVGEIKHLVDAAANRGDFGVKLDGAGRDGYVSELCALLNRLSEITESGLKDVLHVANALSEGDLTARVETDYPGIFGEVIGAVNQTVRNLQDLIVEIKNVAEGVNEGVAAIMAGNRDLSRQTADARDTIARASDDINRLTKAVAGNTGYAREANELAQGASRVAERGGEVVRDVVQTMDGINASSRKIEDIISVIDGIAFQTNILALNAAVEAARAGEQGRGFAVVASEVRNLAQRSAAAAKEIKVLIEDSVQRVDEGSKLVAEAGTTMDEIVASINNVTGIMSLIAHESHEQAAGIEAVNRSIGDMERVTRQNEGLASRAMASVESLDEQAQRLNRAVDAFRVGGALPRALPPPK